MLFLCYEVQMGINLMELQANASFCKNAEAFVDKVCPLHGTTINKSNAYLPSTK